MTLWRLIPLAALLMVIGCDRIDPYLRQGVWHPTGANNINLRAMVLVPSDLVAARPAPRPDGGLAAAAAQRLRTDRVRPLPDSGLAKVELSGGGQPAPAPIAPPAGNGN